jgi:hypothetical protein
VAELAEQMDEYANFGLISTNVYDADHFRPAVRFA